MEYLLRMLAQRQPPHHTNLIMQPRATSPNDVSVDLSYVRNKWLVKKHYHINVTEERAAVYLESFDMTYLG